MRGDKRREEVLHYARAKERRSNKNEGQQSSPTYILVIRYISFRSVCVDIFVLFCLSVKRLDADVC